jgi:hypothetical protein
MIVPFSGRDTLQLRSPRNGCRRSAHNVLTFWRHARGAWLTWRMGRHRPTGVSPGVEGPFGDEAVKAELVGNRVGGAPALDERSIREIVGLAHPSGRPRPVRAERA